MLKGSIAKRIDPFYYKYEFSTLRSKLKNNGNFKAVGKLIKSWNRGDGPRNGFYTDDTVNGVYFIRVNNLKNHSIDLTDIKYIFRKVHEKTLKRTKVTSGDLIFAISGTKDNLGTVSIIPDNIQEANLNSALVRLDLDENIINKKYFCYFFDLQITRTQIEFIGKGAAQNNLNNEEISQIQIYLPDMNEQEKIINYFDNALNDKKKLDQKSKALLDSIDNYILEALSIKAVNYEAPNKEKVFYRYIQEITGKRFDAFYYQKYFEKNLINITNGEYNCLPLKNIIKGSLIKGKLPKEKEKNGPKKVIQIRSINANGSINTDNILTSKNIFQPEQQLTKNDILVVITGATIGKIAYWYIDGEYYLGGDIVKFQVEDGINPYFIFNYLMSKPIQIELKRNITGATNGHLSLFDIRNIPVPLPPIDIQNAIAERIKCTRNEAKSLQIQANEILHTAKNKIEKMILNASGL